MEAYQLQNASLESENSNVFSEDFICTHIVNYFKKNNYKVSRDKALNLYGREEKIIIASKFFRKEIVEVKGCQLNGYHEPGKPATKALPLQQSRSSLSDMVLNSFISLGNFYRDENIIISIAVPNVPRYRAIINRLHNYFTSNDLYFKVYLVNENGDVEVFNLNEQHSHIGS